MTEAQLDYYRGKHYEAEKKVCGGNGSNQHTKEQTAKIELFAQPGELTYNRLAKQYGICGATIKKNGNFAKAVDRIGKVSPEAKEKLLSGEVKYSKRMRCSTTHLRHSGEVVIIMPDLALREVLDLVREAQSGEEAIRILLTKRPGYRLIIPKKSGTLEFSNMDEQREKFRALLWNEAKGIDEIADMYGITPKRVREVINGK